MTSALLHLFHLFGREAESLSVHKSLPNLGFVVFFDCLCGAEPLSVSQDYEFFGRVSWLLRHGVCLLMEIKCCKRNIRNYGFIVLIT